MANLSSSSSYPLDKKHPISELNNDDDNDDLVSSAGHSRQASVDTLQPSTSPPAYDLADTSSHPQSSSASSSSAAVAAAAAGHIPTVDSPFDFPTTDELPAYSFSSTSTQDHLQRPLAIPQFHPDPTSPFLSAYSPTLLSLGIPPESWLSFLSTLSAFLTAHVSAQALSHAADVGRRVARPATELGRSLATHTAELGREIGRSGRRFDIPGVVFQSLGLAVGTVGIVVGSAVSLPARTLGAVAAKPKTPRQRAEAYVATANAEWFAQRGLRAVILGTGEVAEAFQVSVEEILQTAGKAGEDGGLKGQLKALEPLVGRLEVKGEKEEKKKKEERLEIGRSTLWLVLAQQVPE